MAKKLIPWKTAPKAQVSVVVGSPEYGELEIPKKETLTVNEAHFIREETKELPDVQEQAIQLAAEISKDKGIPFAEAFAALTTGGDAAQEFAPQLIKFQREMAETSPIRNAILATAMMRRVMGKDWSVDQTAEDLPPQLIADLADFCSKEMNGWVEPETVEEEEPVTEETLKKD